MPQMPVIGERLTRVDALEKVTGTAIYPADIHFPEMAWARALRSPHPHARIVRVDTQAARSLPGVVSVLTASDVDGANQYGLVEADQPTLAHDKVRYRGDAIAVVVADTEEIAAAAIGLIDVVYTPLPGVFDPADALADGAPLVHEDGRHPGNLVTHQKIRRGNCEEGFRRADIIVEGTYSTPFQEHAFLQPEAGIATIDDDGLITIYTATQWPDEDLREIASCLGYPRQKLRLVNTAIGGAFGGREDISVQIHLALAVLVARRPVKMVWSREESIRVHPKRHPMVLRYKMGATHDGILTAAEIDILADAGAYASTTLAVVGNAASFASGPYVIPHLTVDARAAYTNNTVTAAFRGFGANQVCFALEVQMDKIAARLGMDPLELRRKNLVRDGSLTANGQVLSSVGAGACLEAVAAQLSWPNMRQAVRAAPRVLGLLAHKQRGLAVACGVKNVGYSMGFGDKSRARIEIYEDHAVLKIGTAEVGQGVATTMCQIAAEALGWPMDRVSIVWSDTALVPDAGSASASRHTLVSGNAVRLAATQARWAREAALRREAPIAYPLTGEATYHIPATTEVDPETGQGEAHSAFQWGVTAAEVEVDTMTGEVTVLRLVTAIDAGRALNPLLLEGQIEGGAVMGQGYGLSESVVHRDGVARTGSFSTYLIPSALDAPRTITSIIIEDPDPNGPYGAKGIAEVVMLPIPPAIVNAIYHATGAWVHDIPATAETVARALQEVGVWGNL